MNEEIKEILDKAKKLKDKCSCCEQISSDVYVSRYHELETQNLAEAVYIIDKLLDYITNLQEKYEGAILVGKELNKENERLKEETNELDKMCKLYSKLLYYAELTDYKSRNEKAIKQAKEKIKRYESYINDLKKGNYPSSTIRQERQELIFRIREQEDLLNILQRKSDKE